MIDFGLLAVTILGSVLSVFWLVLYFKGKDAYADIIDSISEDDYMMSDEMKNKIAGFATETDEIVGGIRDKDVDTSTGVMLTMNYKEYLKLFTIIGFVAGNEDSMLSRVGALVIV